MMIDTEKESMISQIGEFISHYLVDVPKRWRWNLYRFFIGRFDLIKIKGFSRFHYYDYDERILHGMFSLFLDFCDSGKLEYVDWYGSSKEHASARWEIAELYHWWTRVRPRREDQDPLKDAIVPDSKFIKVTKNSYISKDIDSKDVIEAFSEACKESCTWERKCIQEDHDQMKRLINILGFLWS